MVEIETKAQYRAPDIPNKFDIIPIHNSDRGSFKRCRRYWDWSSPARHNLSVRADVVGINTDLWFGTGVHYALQAYYTPNLRRDPVEAFKTYWDIQWRGGVVTEDWLDLVYDLKPRPNQPEPNPFTPEVQPTWCVRGLEDILPDPDHEKFDELRELGIGMMQFYKRYAEKNDAFEVFVAEHQFSVPVWNPVSQRILTMVDTREDSPNYGKELEVHARGRQDALWIDPAERVGITDHKTAARIDEDYFEKLENDEQCTSYLWAAEVEATYYDLPYKGQPITEVLYNVMRKNFPRPPTVVRGGLFSVDRSSESATYELLMEWITENNIDTAALSEKHQGYISWLRDVGDEQFIIRKHVRRNRHEIANAGYRLYLESLDMLDPQLRIYPNITNDWKCLRCQFRAPCLAQESGADYQQLINDNYASQRDR